MKEHKIVLKVLSGSHAYGLQNENSDMDFRGVFVNLDEKSILGINTYEVQETKNPDTVIYELRKFCKIGLQGNTIQLETLWCDGVIEIDPVGKALMELRQEFISMKCIPVFRGYALSEHRKTVGLVTGQLGDARKKLIEKYGYSVKNATQALRLLWVGENLCTEGVFKVKVEEPYRTEMLAVKNGQVPINEYILLRDQYLQRFEKAAQQPRIQTVPKYDRIWNFCIDVYRSYLISSSYKA